MKKKALALFGAFPFLLLALSQTIRAQALFYSFDASGTSVVNDGSKGSSSVYNLTIDNTAGVATDYHGAAGSGVSGAAGDRALDLTSANGMGNATGANGPTASNAGGAIVFDADTSLTIEGWFNAAAETGSGARLLAAGGLSLSYNGTGSTGTLSLSLPSGSSSAVSSAAYSAGGWQFFAVTWVASTGAVTFYSGNSATAPTAAGTGTVTVPGGAMSGFSQLLLGGDATGAANNRTFDGLLDDIGVYTSTTDASGALDAATLNSIRLANLDAVPEPGTWGYALAGFLALLAWGRARTKTAACPV